MAAPRKGSTGTYQTNPDANAVTFAVIGCERNICWVRYAHTPDVPSCFVWRFKDTLNQFHDWPGKHED